MTARLVYSTEHGSMCPDCGNPTGQCTCCKKVTALRGDGIVRVGRETKGRKGKGVTLISGVPLDDKELITLAKHLKQRCGSGGCIKNGIIEIQGDHRDTIVKELTEKGFTVRRTGA